MLASKSVHWKRISIYKFPLILALLIHLVFVVMLARITPAVKQPPENILSKPLSSLSVSLQPIPAEIIKPVENEQSEPEPEPVPVPIVKKTSQPPPVKEIEIAQAVTPKSATEEDNRMDDQQPNTSLTMSSENLHKLLIQQLQDNRNLAKSAQLGKFTRLEFPANWTRKAVSYTPGMFRSAQLPTKAVVLDQWKSPDGGMQNRVKLPNGDVVCGNLAAHNPLDIYSMPIWMYRSC